MFYVELCATLFSIWCVALTVRSSMWCWPVGILGILGYAWVFFDAKLYADTGLQAVYLGQSVYGWYWWKRSKEAHQGRLTVRRLPGYGAWTSLSLIALLLWAGLYWLLVRFTDSDVPAADALTTALSLVAQGLLIGRYRENWLIWILADALLVPLFLYKELYMSAITYMIFLGMAVAGWLEWGKIQRLAPD